MEFTLDFEAYHHAQLVQQFGWKCLICSVEAKDQMGLEEQHLADGVIYTDNIDGTKWLFCNKCKNLLTTSTVSVQIWNQNIMALPV